MKRVVLAIIAGVISAILWIQPAPAEIARGEAALAGRTICWWSGWDSEQYGKDHTYIYSYHEHIWTPRQYVVRGVWSIGRDGTVTLSMEGGSTLTRKYDVNGANVVELTGTLNGGAEGYFCQENN